MSNHIPNNETDQASDQDIMVCADHVSMMFNIANERISNLKEYFIKIVKHELMFKEFKALDDVSFEVRRGDVFGLVGTNGSGKSTMLKIIAGVLDPTEGTCAVNGTIAPLIELGAGFDMELSARENIYLNGALLGYSKQFMDEHFDSIVEFADVEGFLEMPMKNYSSGMVARIAFAIATETIPDILIVDEVLSVGDFMFQKKCEKRISSLIEDHGVTVLIVSHDNALIQRLCNKAIWIEKGHTRAYGEAKEVCELYRVLGGHSGSSESSEKVRLLFEAEIDVPANRMSSISASDRYGFPVRLLELCDAIHQTNTVVLASGTNHSAAFIANSIAGAMEAPVLLIKNDYIPDIVLHALSQMNPKDIILIGIHGDFDDSIINQLGHDFECELHRIIGKSVDEAAFLAYEFGLERGLEWSRTSLITHEDCIADHIAFQAFVFKNKIPVFFNRAPGHIADETFEAISCGNFNELLVVGGFISFPDEVVETLLEKSPSIESERFCAQGSYEASVMIAEWILRHSDDFSLKQLIISSVLTPEDAFAIGFYAARNGSIVLMEDPQDLDSVSMISTFISQNRDAIQRLLFLGTDRLYSAVDKQLLAKSLYTDNQ